MADLPKPLCKFLELPPVSISASPHSGVQSTLLPKRKTVKNGFERCEARLKNNTNCTFIKIADTNFCGHHQPPPPPLVVMKPRVSAKSPLKIKNISKKELERIQEKEREMEQVRAMRKMGELEVMRAMRKSRKSSPQPAPPVTRKSSPLKYRKSSPQPPPQPPVSRKSSPKRMSHIKRSPFPK